MEPLADVFNAGWMYTEMVAAATKNADLYRIARAHAVAPVEYAARIDAIGRPWHLLTLSEDWCGDSVNTLPWVDALAASSALLDHRIVRRDTHPTLMDAHLTNGRTRSIPIVLILDEEFRERGWWGPRSRDLQEWFEGEESQAMTKDERYKILRTRYAKDRGRAIMDEIVALIESIAAQDEASPSATAHAAPQA